MRAMILLGCVLSAVVAMVITTVMAVDVVGANEAARAGGYDTVSCDAMVGPTQPGDPRTAAVEVQRLDAEQRGIAALIIAIGKQRKLSPRAWQIAIQAGMTESRLRNVDYGDRDSLGIFQMRPSMGWGSVAEVTNPTYQVNKFYDVLENVPNWDNRRPGESAQAVERSAFPERYHTWEPMAVHLLGNIGKIDDPAGCGEGAGPVLPPNKRAAKVLSLAMKWQGTPYAWGGGDADGPTQGISDGGGPADQHGDFNKVGFDCSGLMLHAYANAGVTLPRVSRDQYHAGAKLPVAKAQPGDLLFWAYDETNPSTIHHVAMYVGNGQIVEARQSGTLVHTRAVAFDEAELLPVAVRPGV